MCNAQANSNMWLDVAVAISSHQWPVWMRTDSQERYFCFQRMMLIGMLWSIVQHAAFPIVTHQSTSAALCSLLTTRNVAPKQRNQDRTNNSAQTDDQPHCFAMPYIDFLQMFWTISLQQKPAHKSDRKLCQEKQRRAQRHISTIASLLRNRHCMRLWVFATR